MIKRMSDEDFAAYETDAAAGMLLMDDWSGNLQMVTDLWGWMQAERAKVKELERRTQEPTS